uniref:Juvenile hormone binding protein n=1 Tax=Riptortus pedestris TaxID=329032 RepID=R4WCJ3_RIPPE|nr:unknown secreted protein [Riptortus pedestris]
MMKLLAVLFLASLAHADKVIDINKQIDEGLKKANSILTARGLGLHPVPDHKFDDLELKRGVHVGINSLQRSDDATLTIGEDGKVSVDIHVGWHLFETGYALIKTQGLLFSGVVRVGDSSFRIAYDIVSKPECKVSLSHLEYERLADAQFSGSLPETDRDISDVFSQHVLPYFNEKFAKAKGHVERVMNEAICRHPRGLVASQNHITTIIDALGEFL